MANFTIIPDDLAPFTSSPIPLEKAYAMIQDAMAMAALVAPCITEDTFTKGDAAKAIIRGAILRWNSAGDGATTTQQAGPYSATMTTPRKGMFWPSEITDLQNLCPSVASGAFTIDTVGVSVPVHADICSLNFGATYCSCGAILTQSFPLYES